MDKGRPVHKNFAAEGDDRRIARYCMPLHRRVLARKNVDQGSSINCTATWTEHLQTYGHKFGTFQGKTGCSWNETKQLHTKSKMMYEMMTTMN